MGGDSPRGTDGPRGDDGPRGNDGPRGRDRSRRGRRRGLDARSGRVSETTSRDSSPEIRRSSASAAASARRANLISLSRDFSSWRARASSSSNCSQVFFSSPSPSLSSLLPPFPAPRPRTPPSPSAGSPTRSTVRSGPSPDRIRAEPDAPSGNDGKGRDRTGRRAGASARVPTGPDGASRSSGDVGRVHSATRPAAASAAAGSAGGSVPSRKVGDGFTGSRGGGGTGSRCRDKPRTSRPPAVNRVAARMAPRRDRPRNGRRTGHHSYHAVMIGLSAYLWRTQQERRNITPRCEPARQCGRAAVRGERSGVVGSAYLPPGSRLRSGPCRSDLPGTALSPRRGRGRSAN